MKPEYANYYADLEEKVKAAEIPDKLFEYDFSGIKVICPNCGKKLFNKNEYNGEKPYCEHCHTELNALHFTAKKHFGCSLDECKRKNFDYNLIVSKAAIECGIKGDRSLIAQTDSDEEVGTLQPARVDEGIDTSEKRDLAQDFNQEPSSERQKLFGENATEFLKNHFPGFIAENQKFQYRKTGFSNIDAESNFQSGVYILGGLPALGKTTFALQLLNQLAKQGETCIFCSFEMSAGYLYSKLLAQEINLLEHGGIDPDDGTLKKPPAKDKNHKFIKTSDIVFGNFQYHEEEYRAVMKKFEENPLPLYIWEIEEIDLKNLLSRIRQICQMLKKPPVVCIDYLQLLTGATDNQKSALDDTLHKLFAFRRETGATFIVISSLNRANYHTEISFESFCGSGGIEYSADVIWGLQLKLEKRTPEDAEEAKKEIPRRIQLKCLKNRFGANYDVGFFYYPNLEIFSPMLEYGEFTDSAKTKGRASRCADEDKD